MSEAQKRAVLARDYNGMLGLGGNIYFLAKIFSTDGKSFQHAGALMTGMSQEAYAQMMLAGGRSPNGAGTSTEKHERTHRCGSFHLACAGHRRRHRQWPHRG